MECASDPGRLKRTAANLQPASFRGVVAGGAAGPWLLKIRNVLLDNALSSNAEGALPRLEGGWKVRTGPPCIVHLLVATGVHPSYSHTHNLQLVLETAAQQEEHGESPRRGTGGCEALLLRPCT